MKMTTSGAEINKNHRGANVNKTAEMTKMALMVAMNCVSAYIIIPLPFSLSPIALQTLIVNLTGYVLNAKQAFMTMLVYLFGRLGRRAGIYRRQCGTGQAVRTYRRLYHRLLVYRCFPGIFQRRKIQL